jgi:hypothetical protein
MAMIPLSQANKVMLCGVDASFDGCILLNLRSETPLVMLLWWCIFYAVESFCGELEPI